MTVNSAGLEDCCLLGYESQRYWAGGWEHKKEGLFMQWIVKKELCYHLRGVVLALASCRVGKAVDSMDLAKWGGAVNSERKHLWRHWDMLHITYYSHLFMY